jgi:hypothetical protein
MMYDDIYYDELYPYEYMSYGVEDDTFDTIEKSVARAAAADNNRLLQNAAAAGDAKECVRLLRSLLHKTEDGVPLLDIDATVDGHDTMSDTALMRAVRGGHASSRASPSRRECEYHAARRLW